MDESIGVSEVIAAPAEKLYDMVSDVTRMGEWSPETTECRWIRGASGPAVGARFRGDNSIGPKSWSITCEVTAADRGRLFVFDSLAGPIHYARWTYSFEPEGDATRVTEAVEDRRGKLLTAIGKVMTGVSERDEHNRAGMRETLANLRRAAES